MDGNFLLKKLLDKYEREVLINIGIKLMDLIYKNTHPRIENKDKTYYKDGDGRIVIIHIKKKKKIHILQSDVNFFLRILPVDYNKFKDVLKHWFVKKYNITIRHIETIENTSAL
jgi:hypothetical protein